MRFLSFRHQHRETYGAVQHDRIVDLGHQFGTLAPDLKRLIEFDLLGEAAAYASTATDTLGFDDVALLPVIPNPGKILCVGLNYGEHVRESGRELTEQPTIFVRVADSQLAHGESIVRPRESLKLDYEGEIALVIGKGGRRIREDDAYDHIAGYACYNDASVRDWQLATSQWTAGKNFWRTGSFGPWMVTRDAIADDHVMTLTTRLNGEVLQHSTTDKLIHSVPRLIAHVSTFTPLAPGDVIVTGTPGGVGSRRTPPVWMQPGDCVEVEVDAIGVLRNTIVAE
ncbi:fumarylacetoacetate hydrolase family protein [Pararobbsia silviterrae]|uniref:FAA hydrolase family protein n=1 Tax=Pararobbsia silviterrae TaxID=1792498 RepID=A0A494XSG5_9BURK|nr:fumarylacetoacetate hydrolase family protein [Pararobbsia silviterrae]RKP53569.1 FAA hydrolase family protein [Pararobbsia silviterrae]